MIRGVLQVNSVELMYAIFRMRYSVDDINRAFAGRYSLCLMGSPEDCVRMRDWLGEYSLSSGAHPEKNLVTALWPEDEDEGNLYRNMDAIVCHLGVDPWSVEEMSELVACMPTGVPVLYICEPVALGGQLEGYEEAHLPEVHCLRPGSEEEHFAALLFSKFKGMGMRLARDYRNLRDICVSSLTTQAANRMAVVAAASSVSVNVPLLGQLLGLLAAPVETLAITAEQMRLVLYIGGLYGRPLNFFDRINELWGVVGSGWLGRTVARQLVGFVPGAGFLAKAAVAWVGTYCVGEVSRRYYELGEKVPASIELVVNNGVKHRVARAAKLKFRNNETEAAVAAMLGDADAETPCGKDEPLPVVIDADAETPCCKDEPLPVVSDADAETLCEEDEVAPVADTGGEEAEVAAEPQVPSHEAEDSAEV